MRIIPAITHLTTNKEPALWILPDDALSRFGRGYIYCMALSPNGEHLALGTSIGLWWYDVDTLSPITLWNANCERISAIAFSASGEWIATGHESGSVKMWDVQQGNCLSQTERQAHRLHKKINQLIFSPDSKLLAANGSNDYVVDVWNPETGEQLARFGNPELRFHVCMKKQPLAFSQDNQLLACASPPNDAERLMDSYWSIAPERDVVSIWNVSDGERITQLNECKDFLHTLIFSPCGNNLVATVEDAEISTLTVWDTENWQVQRTEQSFECNQLIPAYSTEGKLRVAAVYEVTATIWDAVSLEKLESHRISQGDEIQMCNFNGSQLVLATTHELNVLIHKEQHQLKVGYNSHPEPPISLEFSPDKKTPLMSRVSAFDEFCYKINTDSF